MIGQLGRIKRPVPANAPSLRAHAIAGRQAPMTLDRSKVIYRPQMFGNDKLGNCTCALIGNSVLGQAALVGYQANVTTADVVQLYSDGAGYVPGNAATDQGAVEVDLLSWQSRHGFKTGQPTPLIGLWANIEPGDLNMLRLAVQEFGVGYLGVDLAEADAIEGVTWDTNTPASYGNPKPGSLGAHALGLWSWRGLADTDIVELITWGRKQLATWRWLRSRMDESHALLYPQIIGTDGKRAGVDMPLLANDNEQFRAVA